MTDQTSVLRKFISTTLAAALMITAPGLGCWEAAARVVGRVPAAMTPVPGGLNAAMGMPHLSPGAGTLQLTAPSAPSLTGTLPVLERVALPAASAVAAGAVQQRVDAGRLPTTSGGDISSPEGSVTLPRDSARSAATAVLRYETSPSKAIPQKEAPRAAVSKTVEAQQKAVAAAVESLPEAARGDAHAAGVGIMNMILGRGTRSSADSVPVAAASRVGTLNAAARLAPSRGLRSKPLFKEAPVLNAADQELPAPRGAAQKARGVLVSAGRMALGAAAVVGLNAGAIFLLPSLFGALPAASVWAVSSGVILMPLAFYSRYRMGLRNSTRLNPVKAVFDLAIGAFLGSAALAVLAVTSGAFTASMAAGLPALAGVAGFGVAMAAMSKASGGTGGWINAILTWASLNLLTPFIGSVAASPLALGGLLGLAALPAITTIAFFLGRIISSAESGRPFSVPGSMQQIRFPAYTWVMTGVVFALLTGYAPVWTNVAFGLWMFLGKTRAFNLLWGGLGVWAAITGFAAPVTFLFLAFAPERAAMGMEWLLGKILKRGAPAPSTKVEPLEQKADAPERWPKFNYWLKTALAVGSLAALGFVLSEAVLGVFAIGSLGVNLAVAGAMAFIPFWFSKWLIKKMMRAEPMTEVEDPEVFGIMRELRAEINASLKAKGKKEIPMPEMVNVPMPVPNAFATGRSPHSAMVGVTMEMKDMTLNPERLREGLIRLVKATDANGKSFAVFRRAIRGSLPDLAEDAAPVDVIAALEKADRQDLKKLGVRALRGVMGHEFNHVMHRDMLLGAITGTISQGIAFTAYGVLWAVGHAQAIFTRLWRAAFGAGKSAGQSASDAKEAPARGVGKSGRSVDPQSAEVEIDPYQRQAERVRPQVFEPVTTGAAATGILSLVKILVALWAPVIATLISMASSRTREGHADEGGALLTKDPESLALGLGLLTSWRPPAGFVAHSRILPLVAAQAHIMTVNPIEQLRDAKALPEPSRIVQMAVGKEDNFFFNLFITHPDTTQRIERLHDMAEALAAERSRREDRNPGNARSPGTPQRGRSGSTPPTTPAP